MQVHPLISKYHNQDNYNQPLQNTAKFWSLKKQTSIPNVYKEMEMSEYSWGDTEFYIPMSTRFSKADGKWLIIKKSSTEERMGKNIWTFGST